jgi:UDP-glucose 4-epimerase
MKALVTGGAGFIGSNLCKSLIEKGAKVTVLDDLSTGYTSNLEGLSDLLLIKGDIRNADTVAQAITGCDVVFHLAASVGNKRSIDHPSEDSAINVNGTMTVLEAVRHAGVRKIIVSSSAGIYGELKTVPIAENHPLEPLTPYGVSKLYTEKMSLAFANVYGFEAVCLRYFNVYGPHQRFDAYGNVIPIFVFKALRGEPIIIFGDGSQTRDFVYVDDVVQANIKAALSSGVSGAFNIASAQQMRILKLATAVNTYISNPVPIEYHDPRAGDVFMSLADISAAKAAFGYSPLIGIEHGLSKYMNWAKKEAGYQQI